MGKKENRYMRGWKNGDALSLLHATFRTILKFLPWELSHFLVYRLIYIGDGEVPIIYYLIGGLIYSLMFAYILTAIFTKHKNLYMISWRKHRLLRNLRSIKIKHF